MNILILNGSPRPGGNTSALIGSFSEGASESGHGITRMDVCMMDIRPCMGCLAGGGDKESPCTQKDDMDIIYKALNAADIVVFASPMYCWSITAQLKAVLDRMFAITEANSYRTPYKECIMLMAAEGDENDEGNVEPARHYWRSLLRNLGWKDLGMVLAGGVLNIGDIKGHAALERAKLLGRSL